MFDTHDPSRRGALRPQVASGPGQPREGPRSQVPNGMGTTRRKPREKQRDRPQVAAKQPLSARRDASKRCTRHSWLPRWIGAWIVYDIEVEGLAVVAVQPLDQGIGALTIGAGEGNGATAGRSVVAIPGHRAQVLAGESLKFSGIAVVEDGQLDIDHVLPSARLAAGEPPLQNCVLLTVL
jgi:hypothetical protein